MALLRTTWRIAAHPHGKGGMTKLIRVNITIAAVGQGADAQKYAEEFIPGAITDVLKRTCLRAELVRVRQVEQQL